MDPTLFASFEDADAAERAFTALLDMGVQPEDLSLVVNTYAPGGPPLRDQNGDMLAQYDPPVANGLDHMTVGYPREEDEGSDTLESRVGGGISTSTPDDAADRVNEMDDGQSVAEDQAYRENGRSYGAEQNHDVTEGALHGYFNTTEPDHATIGAISGPDDTPGPTYEISAIEVPGLGRVLGDGTLATLATGAAAATARGGGAPAKLAEYLVDAGVPQDEVDELAGSFDKGGAVLAATIRPGDAEGAQAEEVLYGNQAALVRTYTDIPEPNG
jgi:hypothetical protein